MALVSQNPVLFSGSLRYNIEYGLTDCSIDKIREVAKKVNVDEVISSQKNEYDTGTCVTDVVGWDSSVARCLWLESKRRDTEETDEAMRRLPSLLCVKATRPNHRSV